jgi:hypothetical protein
MGEVKIKFECCVKDREWIYLDKSARPIFETSRRCAHETSFGVVVIDLTARKLARNCVRHAGGQFIVPYHAKSRTGNRMIEIGV